MKKLILILLVLSVTAGLYAQNAFFATKAGTVLTYADKDAKGKITSHSKVTILSVQGSGRNMTISYVAELLDKNRKSHNPPQEVPMTVVIKDNVVTMDLKGMFSNMVQDQSIQIDITGTPQEIPANLQVGQSIKDSEMIMTMNMGVMKITTVTKITDAKCEAIEDVTVPAGTFKCHKVTETVTTTSMNRTTVVKIITWFAPGIGTVKTQNFDSKNKLMGSSELVEVKGN
jgi:hypothetical protein